MGAPYRPPVARHTGGHARETWSAPAIGIGGGHGGPGGPARCSARVRLGVTDADLAPHQTSTTTTAPPRVDRHDDGPGAAPTGAPAARGAPIALPFSADRVTAAESPDGAVFAAPQDPTSPSPRRRLGGRRQRPGPDRRARADRHRRAGRRRHQLLRGDVRRRCSPTTARAGTRTGSGPCRPCRRPTARTTTSSRWRRPTAPSSSPSRGATRSACTPSTRARRRRRTCSCSGLGDAIGSDGSVYYERTDHHLAARRPNGATALGPTLADTPNGLGGGVQYLDVVAGGAVWVSEPAGQGLDATYTTYDAATLHQLGSFSGSVTSTVVDSAAGALVLESAGNNPACPAGVAVDADVVRLRHHAAGLGQRPGGRGLRRHAPRPRPGRHRVRHHARASSTSCRLS